MAALTDEQIFGSSTASQDNSSALQNVNLVPTEEIALDRELVEGDANYEHKFKNKIEEEIYRLKKNK